MNKILSYINIKNKFNKKMNNENLGKKQGVVVAEVILMIGITLVIVISCFFPAFRNLVEQIMTTITNWYTSAVANLTA